MLLNVFAAAMRYFFSLPANSELCDRFHTPSEYPFRKPYTRCEGKTRKVVVAKNGIHFSGYVAELRGDEPVLVVFSITEESDSVKLSYGGFYHWVSSEEYTGI